MSMSPSDGRSTFSSVAVAGNQFPRRTLFWSLAGIFAAQLVLLVIAAWNNRDLLNADEVSYLRIASYYAHGQTHLMVSGYWGPLLSWLIAPFILFGLPPLVTGRVAMCISAVVILAGAAALFHNLRFPRPVLLLSCAIVALTSIGWSVSQITPDLMLSGFVALAISEMVREEWVQGRAVPLRAGCWWALAYFTKAVAFPLAFLASLGLASAWILTRASTPRSVLRSLGWTLLGTLLVCAPWFTVLSVKYGMLTFGTSGPLNHAIVGPPDVERYHPFGVTFHHPETGRLTSWEDPAPALYHQWSPFHSSDYAAYQLQLIFSNLVTELLLLKSLDLVGLGLLALCFALALRPGVGVIRQQRWRWLVVPVICLTLIYSPVFAGEQRFFYPVFAMLLGLAMGALLRVTEAPGLRRLQLLGLTLVTVCFAGPGLVQLRPALAGIDDPASRCAEQLANKLRAAGLEGPIAGSAPLNGCRTGLYVAYLMGQPWFGDKPGASADEFAGSNARIILVKRNQSIAADLAESTKFRNLDQKLFGSSEAAAQFPLIAFERVSQ
jgi:hypothetical protein